MHSILIVDDDRSFVKMAKANLEKRGYLVYVAYNGLEALEAFKKQEPDLVILDLKMPDMGGVDVCHWVRAQSQVPILVLSSYHDQEQKVKALDAGADDYVTKPFGYAELLARVRANIRRAADYNEDENPPVVEIGDLVIDIKGHRLMLGEEEVHLTQTEYTLLRELALNLDGIVPHEQLLVKGWGPEYRDATHYLYIYFGRIRDKIGDEYSELIQTVPRQGYILRSDWPGDD